MPAHATLFSFPDTSLLPLPLCFRLFSVQTLLFPSGILLVLVLEPLLILMLQRERFLAARRGEIELLPLDCTLRLVQQEEDFQLRALVNKEPILQLAQLWKLGQ